MPCSSSSYESSGDEVAFSKVACLLGELNGEPFDEQHWRGYHPAVYGKCLNAEQEDLLVSTLCDSLKGKNITDFSLEMQMWWRDHQAADAKRIEKEMEEAARIFCPKCAKVIDEFLLIGHVGVPDGVEYHDFECCGKRFCVRVNE